MKLLNHEPARDLCTRCMRARAMCFCEKVQPFSTTFTVVLLQHPRERKNTIGTARLTHLCISNSLIVHGSGFEKDRVVNALIDHPEHHCVVLFPGKEAHNVSEVRDEFYRSTGGKKLVVFVIDGTWGLAKGMLRRSPRLMTLPQICFTPTHTSEYKVRRQPEAFCLSTIEATQELVNLLDPKPEASVLREMFSYMVEQQVERTRLETLHGQGKRMVLRRDKLENATKDKNVDRTVNQKQLRFS